MERIGATYAVEWLSPAEQSMAMAVTTIAADWCYLRSRLATILVLLPTWQMMGSDEPVHAWHATTDLYRIASFTKPEIISFGDVVCVVGFNVVRCCLFHKPDIISISRGVCVVRCCSILFLSLHQK